MTEYIRNPGRHTNVTHSLFFESAYRRGCGYSFDCDEQGKVALDSLTQLQLKSWNDAQGNEYLPGVLHTSRNSWFDSGSVRCHCGAEHNLGRYDSACDNCGQLFNAVGQQLRPRSEWEESEDY
jgi:hypothetical protein